MCGIWGAIASSKTKALTISLDKYLRSCAIAGTVRGTDGAGIVGLSNGTSYITKGKTEKAPPSVNWHKTGDTGADLLSEITSMVAWENSIEGTVYGAYGHNRAATVGGVSHVNAHPFAAPHAVGIHNGTLDTGWRTRLTANKHITVDSEALIRCISHYGYKHALTKAEGAMAIVWTDTTDMSTYLFRNYERPIAYAHTIGGDLLFASEGKMLEWCADRANIKLSAEGVKDVPLDTVFRIDEANMEEVEVIRNTATPYTVSRAYTHGYATNSRIIGTPSKKQPDATAGTDVEFDEPPLSVAELFEDQPDVVIDDKDRVVTKWEPLPTEKRLRHCAHCNALIQRNSEDYIEVHSNTVMGDAYSFFYCDNDHCLHEAYHLGDRKFQEVGNTVDFIMHTENWEDDPSTVPLPYLTGGYNFVYIHDALQAWAEQQPKIKRNGTSKDSQQPISCATGRSLAPMGEVPRLSYHGTY